MVEKSRGKMLESREAITAREGIAAAREFLETVVEVSKVRVEGVSISSEGGWIIQFAAFLSNPNLEVESGGIKREVFDEVEYSVTLNADGTVQNMAKC